MISSERYQQILAEDIARMNANAARTDLPVPTAEDDMNWLRGERDRKIAATDWTQLPDVPEETRTAWQAYRQALRDVPQNYTNMLDVVWPTEPS
tara:strand:+ start:709 stop:990 length:282 start_codon:yes stop_codon:yes gene_type:complete